MIRDRNSIINKMRYIYYTISSTIIIIALLLSCSDNNPAADDVTTEDTTSVNMSLSIPTNISVDSLRILDTSYYYEYYDTTKYSIINEIKTDTIFDSTNPDIIDSISYDTSYVYDTAITIIKIDRDSILGNFVAYWDPVDSAKRYFIYVFEKSSGDLIRVYNTTETRKFIGGLTPNRTYQFNIAAATDTTVFIDPTWKTFYFIGKKSVFHTVELYVHDPPGNIRVNSINNTIQVSWDPYIDSTVTGYRVLLRDMHGTVIDSTDTLSPSSSFAGFNVQENTAYKMNVTTMSIIGVTQVCSTFVYDITTSQDNSIKLPFVYVSTYKKPDDIGVELVGVKGGIFAMGDIWKDAGESKPVHEVVVSSFYMGKYEITNEKYKQFLEYYNTLGIFKDSLDTTFHYETIIDSVYKIIISGNDTIIIQVNDTNIIEGDTIITPVLDTSIDTNVTSVDYLFLIDTMLVLIKNPEQITFNSVLNVFSVDSGKNEHPVVGVYWTGAVSYCNWLSEKEGLVPCYSSVDWSFNPGANGYRLPTEAEFEYVHSVAFLGTKQRYPWGYSYDSTKYSYDTLGTSKVGAYSEYYGFHDLCGNAMEWCHDWSDYSSGNDFSQYYQDCLNNGVAVNPLGPGSGDYHVLRGGSYKSSSFMVTSVYRQVNPGINYAAYGFRVARNLE